MVEKAQGLTANLYGPTSASRLTHLDDDHASGVERGVRNPTVGSLRRVAQALDTTASRVLAGAESQPD